MPRPVNKWVAVAAEQLCAALACREDCPSDFARNVRNSIKALGEARKSLEEGWK